TPYKQALNEGRSGSIAMFPVLMRDWLHFVPKYNEGAGKLNLSRPGENGSPFFYWPFGARAINYLCFTPNGTNTWPRLLYLVCNPVAWICGLLGLILAVVFVVGDSVLDIRQRPTHLGAMALFLGLYVIYMGVIAQVDREMYLYHYFVPLF